MGRSYPILLPGVLIVLMLCVCTIYPALGKEIYESEKSEEKVTDTMKILEEGLDNLEDAVLQENLPLAVKLTHEIDEASHFICAIDLSRSTLSKPEQKEFMRLRKTLHRRIHDLTTAADEGNTDAMLEDSFRVREACETCHHDFKKGRG